MHVDVTEIKRKLHYFWRGVIYLDIWPDCMNDRYLTHVYCIGEHN